MKSSTSKKPFESQVTPERKAGSTRVPVAVVDNLMDDQGKPIRQGQDCSGLSKERLANFIAIGGVVHKQVQ